jgi:hypothetical protein
MNAWERARANSPERRKARERKARAAAASSPRTALPSVGEAISKALGLATASSTGAEALQSVQGREAILHPTKTAGDDREVSGDLLRNLKRPGGAEATTQKGDLRSPEPPRPAPLPDYLAEARMELRKAEAPSEPSMLTCYYECGHGEDYSDDAPGSFADACARMDMHYAEVHTDA